MRPGGGASARNRFTTPGDSAMSASAPQILIDRGAVGAARAVLLVHSTVVQGPGDLPRAGDAYVGQGVDKRAGAVCSLVDQVAEGVPGIARRSGSVLQFLHRVLNAFLRLVVFVLEEVRLVLGIAGAAGRIPFVSVDVALAGLASVGCCLLGVLTGAFGGVLARAFGCFGAVLLGGGQDVLTLLEEGVVLPDLFAEGLQLLDDVFDDVDDAID